MVVVGHRSHLNVSTWDIHPPPGGVSAAGVLDRGEARVETTRGNVERARGQRPTVVRCGNCKRERQLAPGQDVRSLPPCECTIRRDREAE